ncbi:ABC transporter permease [Conexibacter sp. CPCC 206217]|uniref:ABC transporter permease n=1 Tax=Conexibacter sp. CPCC 206217 TaxID=3064574 RepID=UPI00271E69CC|nr:ABC transporter permease [Conexibacter sp. CPCC 206217]MDO8211078.1 ABC transporter permease [Conexibacter sp. CPCC 206217]
MRDGNRGRDLVVRLTAEGGVVAFLLLMIVAFSLALPDKFPTTDNVQLILGSQAVPALLALAVIVPLIAGEFDLSVAATLGITSVFTAWSTSKGMSPVLALVLALGIGVLIGAINGFLVTVVGVGAFITTLGMATILAGGNALISGGNVIYNGIPRSLTSIAGTQVLGLPIVVFYALAAALVLYYLVEWTPFGRYLQATGKGRDAARLTGVRTERWLFLSFVMAGLIAAFAGYMQTARIGSASPTVGPDFLLPAYAAAFLGATTIHPGRFNVWGTMIGVLVLAVGVTGLNLAGVAFWVPNVFNGAALIVAVSVAVLVARNTRATQAV